LDHLDFLREEFQSVEEALKETLRHDYGPSRGSEYFAECETRLQDIKDVMDDPEALDGPAVAAQLRSLSALGSRICLIERSRLGEFSWPFAEAIRRISEKLFVRKHLDGKDYLPIVHVIAEGMHYQIVNDVQPPVGNHRMMIVAFPRQLKHHVLLHALFGHELGHTAATTPRNRVGNDPGKIISTRVLPAITSQGPLRDGTQATAWFHRPDAPVSITSQIKQAPGFEFREAWLKNWRTEIVCDLFGLLLFGPSFAAAHRMILEPLSADPASFDLDKSTHPPFVVRRRVIVRALELLEWDKGVCGGSQGLVGEAERKFLNYVTEDSEATWPDVLTDEQLVQTLAALREIFSPYPEVVYASPDAGQIEALVDRLTLCRPPIVQTITEKGYTRTDDVKTVHCLYAGWTCWFGLDALHDAKRKTVDRLLKPTFLQINKLCDQALLQQCAIELARPGLT
jgi:hypothetical protein